MNHLERALSELERAMRLLSGNHDDEIDYAFDCFRATVLNAPVGEVVSGPKLYIDCEFNGGRGELISMALVAEDGREFYEVLPLPENIQPWVADNVVPALLQASITQAEFYNRLFAFLDQFQCPHIVADHPADLQYFAEATIVNNVGTSYKGHWTAERIPDVEYESAIPHNALHDARAICRAMLAPNAAAPAREQGAQVTESAWQQIKDAAANSKWIPPEYFQNDWVSDVCDFLTTPPPASLSESAAVAWRWRFKPAHLWNYAQTAEECKWHGDVEYEPLYAQPIAASQPALWGDEQSRAEFKKWYKRFDPFKYDNVELAIAERGWEACRRALSLTPQDRPQMPEAVRKVVEEMVRVAAFASNHGSDIHPQKLRTWAGILSNTYQQSDSQPKE